MIFKNALLESYIVPNVVKPNQFVFHITSTPYELQPINLVPLVVKEGPINIQVCLKIVYILLYLHSVSDCLELALETPDLCATFCPVSIVGSDVQNQF